MNRILLLIAFVTLSCNKKNCQETVRETEAINLFQNLIDEKGKDLVADFPSSKNLPIYLNTKKVIIDATCFRKEEASNQNIVIKIIEDPFKSKGQVCIEKFYKSKLDNDVFFLAKDSLNLLNQNECVQNFIIPKSVIKNYTSIQFTKDIKSTDEYIQFSFPIFSSDNKKAYLEYDHYSKIERYGNSIYLEKINGKWKIKYIDGNWSI